MPKSKPPEYALQTASDYAALEAGCWWDESYAEKVRQFARTFLKPSKGKWANKAVDYLDWQYETIIRPIYSWRQSLRGSGKNVRRIHYAMFFVPKKNGKSFVTSSIALYEAFFSGEPGALVGCFARSEKQAKVVWEEANNFVLKNAHLRARLKCLISKNEIVDQKTFSKLVACCADDKTAHGPDYSAVCFDEIHVCTKELWDCLYYSMAVRDDPLMMAISTAGDDVSSFAYEQLQYIKALNRKVDPIIDIATYGAVFELPEELKDQWDKPESWYLANPSLKAGLLKEDEFVEAVAKIKNEPSGLRNFQQLRLNVWAGKENAWINPTDWNNCKQSFTEADFYGQDCWAGLDLSRSQDNSAVVYLFERDGQFYILPRFFCPMKAAAQKEKKEGFPYRNLSLTCCCGKPYSDCDDTDKHAPQVILTEGKEIDYSRIRQQIVQDSRLFRIQSLGYDQWNAPQLCNQQLRIEDGINMEPIAPTYQGIARATHFLETLITSGNIHHNDHKLMNWNVQNTVVKRNFNLDIIPNKADSTSKIDGVSATVYALSRWLLDNQYSPIVILAG